MEKLLQKKPATTLIEILIYFALLAVAVLVAMNFAIQIGDLYGSSANSNELQSNVNLLESRFKYAVETATAVNSGSSSFGVDNGRLSLSMSDPAQSPTVFYLQDGVVYLQVGASNPVALTSSALMVNYFRLTQITATKSPAQIILDADISIANLGRQGMAESSSVHLTVTLRQ
jgi:Tfp pilus assembly protein FimT